jgi:hypothetical protein
MTVMVVVVMFGYDCSDMESDDGGLPNMVVAYRNRLAYIWSKVGSHNRDGRT